jgi:hypothetical protein
MTIRIATAALAIALVATLPLEAFARGGGGGGDSGGGGGGGGHSASDHGATNIGGGNIGRPQTDADQRLFDQARQECNGPQYPSGAIPRINYDADSFTCFETGSSRR